MDANTFVSDYAAWVLENCDHAMGGIETTELERRIEAACAEARCEVCENEGFTFMGGHDEDVYEVPCYHCERGKIAKKAAEMERERCALVVSHYDLMKYEEPLRHELADMFVELTSLILYPQRGPSAPGE